MICSETSLSLPDAPRQGSWDSSPELQERLGSEACSLEPLLLCGLSSVSGPIMVVGREGKGRKAGRIQR
jgi:hypothetical protein